MPVALSENSEEFCSLVTMYLMALLAAIPAFGVYAETDSEETFQGVIGRTLADSVEWWPPQSTPPADAPNILIWVIDDAGFGQLGPYGGAIDTPAIDQLASNGFLFSNFHTVPLCSPSRASLLTGRNHHSVAMGSHALSPMGFPGYHARVPKTAGTLAAILKSTGYATMALGKWDHMPAAEMSPAGPFDRWPSGQGFERFYGFLAADANHFGPALWEDHAPVPPSNDPDYFLTTDLADKAIEYIGQLRSSQADKPFFMYWATGAVHAPHHAPKRYIDKYSGRFDEGWDSLRKRTLESQKIRGIVPPETQLATKQEEIPDWDTLRQNEKRLYARQMEAFAGQLDHTDYEFSRILDYLNTTGELENTIVVVVSDNGASAEGGMSGVFNENLMFSNIEPTLEQNMRFYDRWGGPETINHYHAGWAAAGNTPFPLFKHHVYRGGTQVPMLLSWPKGADTQSQVITQYHHMIDLAPTLLDLIGVVAPPRLNGVEQSPFDGVSMRYALNAPDAEGKRDVQYYEVWGNRGIWHDGWEAVTTHAGIMPWHYQKPNARSFEADVWQLFNAEEDFSQSQDLAASKPEKLAELKQLWEAEARKHNVYPLDADKTGRLVRELNKSRGARDRYVYFPPGGRRVPEPLSPPVKNRSHSIVAEVTIESPRERGMIATSGGASAGYAFYLDAGVPVYAYNHNGLEYFEIRGQETLPLGRAQLRMDFNKTGEYAGRVTLSVNDKPVAGGEISRTVKGVFSVQEGFDIGMDSGSPVSRAYRPPFVFSGILHSVTFDLL